MSKILVINPNSSKKVTDNLEKILVPPPGVDFTFYTAPPHGPAEITPTTSQLSEQVALPDLISKNVINEYDGFLVCCYSDHPLVHSLGKHTAKPILGIMQATLLYALQKTTNGKLFILTSTSEWNTVLDEGVSTFIGVEEFPIKKFQRTKAFDVNVLNLSDPEEFSKISNRVEELLKEYEDDNIDCILLGCAGMATLDTQLSKKFPHIKFIDSVKIGVELLSSLIRFNKLN